MTQEERDAHPAPIDSSDLHSPQFSLEDWQRLKDTGLNSLLVATREGSVSAANHLARLAVARIEDAERQECLDQHFTAAAFTKYVHVFFEPVELELTGNLLRLLNELCGISHDEYVNDARNRVAEIINRTDYHTVRDEKEGA